jgi:hypothetical protein
MHNSKATCSVLAAILAVLAGCALPPDFTPNDQTGDAIVTVVNSGQTAVRIGIDRSTSVGAAQPAPTLTDLTPLLMPGESVMLTLPGLSSARTFDVFIIGPDSQADLLGPFPCRIDLSCFNADATQIIWTGSTVLCTGRLDQAVVELANQSDRTVYLLVEDEQPALPLLPLTPGESRFVELPRTGLAGSFRVRAVSIGPILGPNILAFTDCSLFQTCAAARVQFDGQRLNCVGF